MQKSDRRFVQPEVETTEALLVEEQEKAEKTPPSVPTVDGARVVEMVQRTMGNQQVQQALQGAPTDLNTLIRNEIQTGVKAKGETPTAFDSNGAMQNMIAEMARRAKEDSPPPASAPGPVPSKLEDELKEDVAALDADPTKESVPAVEEEPKDKDEDAKDKDEEDKDKQEGGEDEPVELTEALEAKKDGGKQKKREKPKKEAKKPENEGKDAKKVSPKEEMDALKARQESLQSELEDIGEEMEDNQEELDEIGIEISEVDVDLSDRRADLDARKATLQKKAEKAKEKQKPARDPNDDSTVRSLKRKTEVELPADKEELNEEAEEIRLENEELTEEQQALQEELNEVGERLAELQPKGGGGGGGPTAEPNYTKTSEKLLGILNSKTKPKLKKETEKAEKKQKDIEKQLTKLDTDEAAADTAILNATSGLSTANGIVNGEAGALGKRKETLDKEAGEGKTGDATKDPESQTIKANARKAKGDQKRHQTALNTAKTKKQKCITDRVKAKADLEKAKEAVKEAKKKEEDLVKSMADLAAPGSALWDKWASDFGVTCAPIPLKPGETNEAHGEAPPPEPDEEASKAAKDADAAAKERGEAGAGVDPNKDDKGPKAEPEKKLSAVEQAKKDKEEKEAAIAAEVSATMDKSPEERAKAWAAMKDKYKLDQKQMEAIHKARVDAAIKLAADNQKAALAKNKGAKFKDSTSLLKASGLTPSQIKIVQAAEARAELQKKAIAMVGGKIGGQEAVDKLHAMGKSRKMSPGALVKHLEGVDPKNPKLSPEMKKAAQVAHGLRLAEIMKLPVAEQAAAHKANKAHMKAANTAEKDHHDTQDLAKSMDCSPEQAKTYVDRLVQSTGCTREAAAKSLKNKDKSKTPMSPKDIQAELKRIHMLDPGKRSAEMALLAGKVDPQQLIGATMIPTEGKPGALIEGAMGNDALKSQIDAINALPADQQADAWRDLSVKTDLNPGALYAANKRYERTQAAHTQFNNIQNSTALNSDQKKAKLEELAKKLNLSVDKLKAAAANKLADTKKKLELAKGSFGGLIGGDSETSNAMYELNKGLKDGTLTPAQADEKLKAIAKRTGIPYADLKNLHGHEQFKGKQKEWAKKTKKSPQEASDYVANKARKEGIPPEKVMDWLQGADPSKMDADDKAMAKNVKAWHKANPSDEEATDDKAREKAGLGKDGKPIQVCFEDEKAGELTGNAKVDYDQMLTHETYILKELKDTVVNEAEIVKRLTEMPTRQLAALLKRNPELRKKLGAEINNNSQGEATNALKEGMRKAFEKGNAYNTVIAGESGNSARNKKAEENRKWAMEVQEKTIASVKAADALGLKGADGLDEARAHLTAYSLGTGKSFSEAVEAMKNGAPKTASEVLGEAYAAKSKSGGPSESLRRRLAQINAMPPGERAKALASLKGLSGLTDEDISAAGKVMAQDDVIAKKMHDMRNLSPAERAAEMKKLAAQFEIDPKDLEELKTRYEDRLAATEAALGKGALDEILTGSFKDIAAEAAKISERTGVPVDEIVRLVEARRDKNFAKGANSKKIGTANMEALRSHGVDCDRTPEAMLDYLMQSPTSALPEELQKLQAQLKKSLPDYKEQYSKAQQAAMDKLRAKAADPEYLKKSAALKSAIAGDDEDAFKDAFGKMSGPERALFRKQYDARRDKAIKEGGEVPESFEKMVHSTVDGFWGWDSSGTDGESGQILKEIPQNATDAEARLQESVRAIDKSDPAYVGNANAMVAELRKGGDADPEKLKSRLKGMSLAERAAFMADYKLLQNAAAQQNLTDDNHKLPSLQEVLVGDPEGLRWVVDAQRAAATGIASAAAADTKKTEAARAAAADAAAALKPMSRRDAYRLVQKQAKDLNVSIRNALRFLKGEEMKPDVEDSRSKWLTDQLEALEADWKKADPNAKTGDKIGGHTLNAEKVGKQAEKLKDLAAGKGGYMSSTELAGILNKCNPRELKELDAALGGKLDKIMKDSLKTAAMHAQCQGHGAHHQGSVVAKNMAEINNSLHGMQDFKAEERDLILLDDAATMDPRAHADPTTPGGMAQRMAWAASLPPEKRIKAFNELRKAVPASTMDAKQVMGAYLDGEQGAEGGMLSPTLLAELQRLEKLPPSERNEALKTFAAMTGKSPNKLRLEAKETGEKLDFAKKVAEIEKLPVAEQLAKLTELAETSKMSVDQLEQAHADALAAGLIKAEVKPVPKHVADELNNIKNMENADERMAALRALASANGLSQTDILTHLKTQLDENRKKRADLKAERKGAQKMDELFRKRDGDAIAKHLEQYRDKPEMLKKIAEQMGGIEELRKKLKGQFGADSEEFVDLDPILDDAKTAVPEPALPDGCSPEMAATVTRLKANLSDWRLSPEFDGMSPEDLDQLEKNADWHKGKFDLKVKAAKSQFDQALDGYTDSDRVKELMDRYPHDVLLALVNEMAPGQDLCALVRSDVSEDVANDFDEKLRQAKFIADLPPAKQKAEISKARVRYKFDMLNKEFNGDLYADDDRIAELLADCSPEELKGLKQKFAEHDLKLEALIDENTGGPGLADVVGAVVGLSLIALGPIGIAAGLAVRALLQDTEGEQSIRNSMTKLRNTGLDGLPAEQQKKMKDANVNAAYDEIAGEVGSIWTSDADILGALKGLTAEEMMALAEKFEGDGVNLLDSIRSGMDDDTYAQAVALMANAEDAAAGINRSQEMNDACRQLAIADRLKELKKNPKYAGKSEYELYDVIQREGSKIDKMAADRVKKIQNSANDIFKAVDGWWNNDTDAMLKTMAGLSPEEVDMVKIEYRRHFGRDFDIDVRAEMGQYNAEEMKVAERLMSSDPKQRVEGLRMYLLEDYRMFKVEDEQMIFDTLENLSVEERTLLVGGLDGKNFLESLNDELGENEQKMVEALTHINPKTGKADANPAIVAAAKMKMHMHGSGDWWDFSAPGTKEEELISELDKLTPAQILEAEAYYNQHLSEGGSTFVADMKDEFGDGRDWAIIEAEMRGDKVSADANRLKWAAQEDNWLAGTGYNMIMGTDEDLLEKTLKAGKEGRGGRDAAHLAKVRARFNNLYGGEGDRYAGGSDDSRDAFDRMVDDETDGLESIYFKEMGVKGEASDEITLLYAMEGDGTDEDKLKQVLNKYYDKSPEERARFAALFQEQSRTLLGRDLSLEEWVGSETSGSEGFDMQLLMMGKPRTPEEQLKVARMRWDFERGAGSGFGNAIMGMMDATGGSSTSEILAENMANLEALFDGEGKLVPGGEDRLKEVAAWQEMDTKNYRETKNSVAEAIGNTVAAVGAVAAGILTAGAAWYIMAAAAMAAAAAGTVFKAVIKGNSFGWEEGLQDLGSVAIAGLTAGMGGGAFKGLEAAAKAATSAFQKYAIVALQGAIEGAIESFLNALLTSEQAWEGGDVAFLTHILKSTALGGLNGATGALTGELLKDGPLGQQIKRIEEGNPAAHSPGKHLALKYTNGVVKAAAGTALDPANWEAWADGKEIGLADLKKVFVMPVFSAAMQTAKARNKGMSHDEIEEQAKKKVDGTEEEIQKLKTQRKDSDDPAEQAEVDEKIRLLNADLKDQKESYDFIQEDNKKLAERAAAKKRVEEALKNDSDGKLDAMEDAQRTGAVKNLVDSDEPDVPAKTVRSETRSDGDSVADDGDVPARKVADNDDSASKIDEDEVVVEAKAVGAKVLRDDDMRDAVDEDFESTDHDPDVRIDKAKQLVADLGGDFNEVMDEVSAGKSMAAKRALNDMRAAELEQMAADFEAANPGFKVVVDTTNPNTPRLVVGGPEGESAEATANLAAAAGAFGTSVGRVDPAKMQEDSEPAQAGKAKPVKVEETPAEETKTVAAKAAPDEDGEDSIERIIERETLSPLRETMLDDGASQLASDPAAALKAARQVADLFDDTERSEVARAIRSEDDPAKAIQVARDLNEFCRIADIDPADMTPGQLEIVAKARNHLQKGKVDSDGVQASQRDGKREVLALPKSAGTGDEAPTTARVPAVETDEEPTTQRLPSVETDEEPATVRTPAVEDDEEPATVRTPAVEDDEGPATVRTPTAEETADTVPPPAPPANGTDAGDDGYEDVRGVYTQRRQIRDADGNYVSDENPIGANFGFEHKVDGDAGELVVRKQVLLLGDDEHTDGAWTDVQRGVDMAYNDPQHKVNIEGEGHLTLRVEVVRLTAADLPDLPSDPDERYHYLAARGIQGIEVTDGHGRANAANLYTKGCEGESDDARAMVAAHEIGHGMFGSPDTYDEGAELMPDGTKRVVVDRDGEGAEQIPDGGLYDRFTEVTPVAVTPKPGESLTDVAARYGLPMTDETIRDLERNNVHLVVPKDGKWVLRNDLEPGEEVTLNLHHPKSSAGLREHDLQWIEQVTNRSRSGEDLNIAIQDTPWAKDMMEGARERAYDEGGRDGTFAANMPKGHRETGETDVGLSDHDRAVYDAEMARASGRTDRTADALDDLQPKLVAPDLADHEDRLKTATAAAGAPAPAAAEDGDLAAPGAARRVTELDENPEVVSKVPALGTRREELAKELGEHQPDSVEGRRTVAKIELIDGMTRLPDPEVAEMALRCHETGSAELDRRLAVALSKNPDDAAAEIRQIASEVDFVEDIGQRRDFHRADPEEVTAAVKRAKAGEPLSDADTMAILDDVVGMARQTAMSSMGTDLDKTLAPPNLAGHCNRMQDEAYQRLTNLGLIGEDAPIGISMHHTTAEGSNFEGAASHYFTVITMPDGRRFLIDPSHGQFLRNDAPAHESGEVGRRLATDTPGRQLATALTQDGFIELNDDNMQRYGRALTGSDRDFSADDYANGNRSTYGAYNSVDGETAEAYGQLPTRGAGHVAPANAAGHDDDSASPVKASDGETATPAKAPDDETSVARAKTDDDTEQKPASRAHPSPSEEADGLRRELGEMAADAGNLSGSRKARAEEVDEILELAGDIEDEDLQLRALRLARDGNAQDRKELTALLNKGEDSLAVGLDDVEASHQATTVSQRVAQLGAQEEYPEQYAKVEGHLGTVVPPLPPELEKDYILQSNGVIRRRDVDDTNFRLARDDDGRLIVAEGKAAPPPPDRIAVYKGARTKEEEERIATLLKKGELTLDELDELKAFNRRAQEFNVKDAHLTSDDDELAEIIDRMARGEGTEADIARLAELGTQAEALGPRVDREQAETSDDKTKASKHLGEAAGKVYVAKHFPAATQVEGVCWDGSGTFDQIYRNPGGNPEYIIVEAKGGGATNSSSREIDDVRYQQGHPVYARNVLDNMIKHHKGSPEELAELKALKKALESGNVAYMEVSAKVDDNGSASGVSVREYVTDWDEDS